jgi:hypothetical protein
MTRDQLDQIIEQSAPVIQEQIADIHEHIIEAAAEALKVSQDKDDGGKPKVIVGLKLVIGLSTAPPSYQVKASVGVTYSTESEPVLLENPNQLKLAFAAGGVEE